MTTARDFARAVNPQRHCQSTNHNHADCYGDLWTCDKCGRTFCENEGSDDNPFLCDDCWAAQPKGEPVS